MSVTWKPEQFKNAVDLIAETPTTPELIGSQQDDMVDRMITLARAIKERRDTITVFYTTKPGIARK